jgi:steroid 5-alpha reductase family enzyme
MSILAILALPQLLSLLWMLLGWSAFVVTDNAGWVDVSWATCLCVLALLNLASVPAGHISFAHVAITVATLVWGVRIGLHVSLRSV